ncbi:hypothetical protein [uncultured Methylobacterium sp.]|uniref:hypothetical protein n=1 Tax=uncultured Methylobacterium sp. TaxID=157278 RepID=UPI0035CB2D92
MLEKRVSGSLPPNQPDVEIRLSHEVLNLAAVPGWDHPDATASKAYGAACCRPRTVAIPSDLT